MTLGTDTIAGVNTPTHRPGTSAWLERAASEIIRGRHLILHGNIHDEVLWQGRYLPIADALAERLSHLGFSTIGRYDQIDGLTVHGDPDLQRLRQIAGNDDVVRTADPDVRPAGDPGRASAYGADLHRIVDSAAPASPTTPAAALTLMRRALAQDQEPTVFLVAFADLLLLDPGRHDQNDRKLLALAKKAMSGAAQVGVRRNTLILIVGELSAVPEWVYFGDPSVQPIEVLRPTVEEREAYLTGIAGNFHEAGVCPPDQSTTDVRMLAHLTDGMTIRDLDGLWRTSRYEHIPLREPRELVSRTLFGRRTNPWHELGARPGASAREELGRHVVGQQAAVAQVGRALAAATLGIDFVSDPYGMEARPKGVFFFAGPTGVGKTELARALSRYVFYDEAAICRFDMSSFSEPHTAERFYGAPPGYVGHERGGELTNRMHQRPFSVLLFDEMEKAHESIFDKFLQILEDGRLTDGLGRTAYFSQSLIIFTSNLGADTIYKQITGNRTPDYAEVANRFEEVVSDHFITRLRRPELLGRIGGGIVPFDIVRTEHVPEVARKFVAQLVGSAARHGVHLEVDEPSVLAHCVEAMADPQNAALGYRQLRTVLDRSLRTPLVDALIERGRTGTYRAEIPNGGMVATVTRG